MAYIVELMRRVMRCDEIDMQLLSPSVAVITDQNKQTTSTVIYTQNFVHRKTVAKIKRT